MKWGINTELSIINQSKSNLTVEINGQATNLTPKQEVKVNVSDDTDSIKIFEIKQSFWNVIVNFVVGAVLGLFDLSDEALSMRKSVKLPTKFKLSDMTADNTIIIGNPYLDFVSCSMILNGKTIDGELELSETELNAKIKEYYFNLITPLFLPEFVLILLAVISAVKGIWIIASAMLLVQVLIFAMYKKHLASNKKTKEYLKSKVKS